MKQFTIMISTMNSGILNLGKVVNIQHPDICYLIIHQNHQNHSIPEFLQRKDINVIQTNTKGLSKSRNIGLENCKTEYALVADDDVEYLKIGINEILNIIKIDKPDFASFMIKTPDNEPEFKDYKQEKSSFINTRLQVASIELLLNIKKMVSKNIYFDERFGLGTILRQGEEEILVNDLINADLKGYYYPLYIVKHPFESTGSTPMKESKKYFLKGAFSKRLGTEIALPKFNSFLRKLKNFIFYLLGRTYILLTRKTKK